jgi:hypothetical protein
MRWWSTKRLLIHDMLEHEQSRCVVQWAPPHQEDYVISYHIIVGYRNWGKYVKRSAVLQHQMSSEDFILAKMQMRCHVQPTR